MNRIVPAVSERQAEVLRLARDGGKVVAKECTPATLITVHACERHRYLAPRGDGPTPFWVLTDCGKTALAHYDMYLRFEQLWSAHR